MDPLSVTASIIAVLHAANKAVNFLVTLNNAPKEKAKLIDELKSTRKILEDLAELSSSTENNSDPAFRAKLPTLRRLTDLSTESSPLASCYKEIEALNASLTPPAWVPEGSRRSEAVQRLTWPFKEKETSQVLQKLARLQHELTLALNVDQTSLTLEIRGSVQELAERTSTIRDDARQKAIYQWLAASNPSLNYNEACKKRQESTGGWFLTSQQYMDWRTVPNSLIWLHGIPGCGKTILSSTIIENVQEYCDRNRGNCLAYFYFAFNDVDRQRCVQMLRSLLDQLCRQDMAAFQLIESLFSSCGSGSRQPTNEQLLGALKRMIRGSSATYVVLDALDECTRRPELLETIQTIDGWQLDTLHMLVTSRLEGDIRETLETIPEIDTVNIQSSLVSEDIRTYICSRLSNDSSLRRWQRQIEIRKEIETELMEKAEGMFRWVECQLDALGKCVTLSMLRKALESLPSTLDETYARILCKIDESYRRLAIKAFKWLVYSQRPLEVQELVEVLAIDVEDEHPFDVDRRLPEHEDLLLICSSLVTVTSILETKSKTVRLAHFSVQEYLISENVLNGPAAMYAARYLHSHTDIAEECISYLRQIASEDSEGELSAAFPLAHYAAIYWIHHARIAGQEQEQRIATSAYELFQPDIFYVWARLVHDYSANHLYGTDFYNFPQRPFVLEELHYATDSGMPSLIEHVLNAGVELDTRNSNGYTSLHIAIRNRDLRIVKLLLDHGADINVFSEKVGPPLTLAAELGYEEIVTALLRHGVDINDVRHGTALIAAAKEGHSTVTRLLISEGADVNKFDPCTGTALIAAADQGHTEMAMELLAEGADVDASGPRDETALGVAAFHGNEKLVRMLLEAGADINLAQDYSGTALYAAALRRQPAIVRLLLENGAGVDENRFGHGTALQGASSQGYDEIVQLLLDKGANVNAEGGNFGTALQRASESGYESTTQLLLANGANVNIEGRFYWGTALQAASRGGYENVVRLLLDKGAEVQTQCGHHGNPLQAASVHGATSVVQLLRDRGARY